MSAITRTTQSRHAAVGASRPRACFDQSISWSTGASMSPKTSAHVATKDFGGNATLHPRPEEIPL